MRVLIVEDEKHVIQALEERLGSAQPRIELILAHSRSAGIEALHSEEFDFIVCDLRLPPYDGGLDADEAHGLAVHAKAKELCPGTPCLFFTGFHTSANVREELSTGGADDVLGNRQKYGMTRLLTKDHLLECVERIEAFNLELDILDNIVIKLTDSKVSLDNLEKRALQMLTRTAGGTSIEGSTLGGYSGAVALRATIKNSEDRTIGSYFAKIGARERMERERDKYQRHVAPLLSLGEYPALTEIRDAGIGKREALFYQLASRYSRSLFDVLASDERAAIEVVTALREIFVPWTALDEKRTIRVRDLRTERIDDAAFQPYRDVLGSAEYFEEDQREFVMDCQHGDLHGMNVLCDGFGKAIVIDFANVGSAPACLDPVMLELSVLFHGDSPFQGDSWPSNLQLEHWFNLEDYLVGCPVPEFIKKCREWANEVGAANNLAPVVYAECVKQLKYQDTNHERAIGIARAAMLEAK